MAAPDLLAPLLARPWAISSRAFVALQTKLAAIFAARPEAFFDLSDLVTARPSLAFDESSGAATISIQGALADKAPPVWEQLGQTDYRTIRTEVEQARALDASSITLAIDSPGGSLAGLEEAAGAIQTAATTIPVTAHCDGMACSAAYWLASAADTISASPSAEVGNIGVVLAWADTTGFFEQAGIEFHTLANEGADLKTTFRVPPTESQLDFLQGQLDEHGAAFRSHVEGNRPSIDPEVFRAGWYSGDAALSLGLVDTISTN